MVALGSQPQFTYNDAYYYLPRQPSVGYGGLTSTKSGGTNVACASPMPGLCSKYSQDKTSGPLTGKSVRGGGGGGGGGGGECCVFLSALALACLNTNL